MAAAKVNQSQARLATALAGILAGVIAVGPPGWDGGLLSLDLVVFKDVAVPEGLFGLGSDLPRRSPLVALIGLLTPPLSGVFLVHVWMIALIATAFIGMARLLRSCHALASLGGALMYAWSPFLLTRIGIGHLGFATAVALLPWAQDTLLRPATDIRRTFLWLCAFACCGYFGGVLAGPMLLAGLFASNESAWARLRVVGWGIVSQLPWLAPALAGLRDSPDAASSTGFATDAASVADAILLVGGYGFWQRPNQIGARHIGVVLLVVALVVLAVIGHRRSQQALKTRSLALGIVALLISWFSAIPQIESAYADATSLLVLAPFREGQRLTALFLLWFIPAAASGLAVLAEQRKQLLVLLPLAAVVMVGPALWGLHDRVRPVAVPQAWDDVRSIADGPGTTLVLPFNQYFDVEIADDRRVHNPLPFHLRGDVLSSHDPELPDGGSETLDRREQGLAQIVATMDADAVDHLLGLGVRYVAILPDVASVQIDPTSIPGAEVLVDRPTIALVELTGWPGEIVLRSGEAQYGDAERRTVPFVYKIQDAQMASDPSVWRRQASTGWLQGTSRVEASDAGQLLLPGGSRWLLYWPALALLSVYAVWLGLVVVGLRGRKVARNVPNA